MATPNKATTKGPKTEHVIDASGQILGRLATRVAILLQGKNTPDYLPRNAGNTIVMVKNASKIKLSGKNKAEQKVYHHHTGYMGHLKTGKYLQIMEKDPSRVIQMAVFNMLPKNWLRQRRMNRLKITA